MSDECIDKKRIVNVKAKEKENARKKEKEKTNQKTNQNTNQKTNQNTNQKTNQNTNQKTTAATSVPVSSTSNKTLRKKRRKKKKKKKKKRRQDIQSRQDGQSKQQQQQSKNKTNPTTSVVDNAKNANTSPIRVKTPHNYTNATYSSPSVVEQLNHVKSAKLYPYRKSHPGGTHTDTATMYSTQSQKVMPVIMPIIMHRLQPVELYTSSGCCRVLEDGSFRFEVGLQRDGSIRLPKRGQRKFRIAYAIHVLSNGKKVRIGKRKVGEIVKTLTSGTLTSGTGRLTSGTVNQTEQCDKKSKDTDQNKINHVNNSNNETSETPTDQKSQQVSSSTTTTTQKANKAQNTSATDDLDDDKENKGNTANNAVNTAVKVNSAVNTAMKVNTVNNITSTPETHNAFANYSTNEEIQFSYPISLHELPRRYYPLFRFCEAAINILKSRTPKVTLIKRITIASTTYNTDSTIYNTESTTYNTGSLIVRCILMDNAKHGLKDFVMKSEDGYTISFTPPKTNPHNNTPQLASNFQKLSRKKHEIIIKYPNGAKWRVNVTACTMERYKNEEVKQDAAPGKNIVKQSPERVERVKLSPLMLSYVQHAQNGLGECLRLERKLTQKGMTFPFVSDQIKQK